MNVRTSPPLVVKLVLMRRDSDFFGDLELDLLYMARRLSDALKLEEWLTTGGIDYAVETGTFTGGMLIKRELAAAFFYVRPADVAGSRQILAQHGYRPYEPE